MAMLWNKKEIFLEKPFEKEPELEAAILHAAPALFGQSRVYLPTKKRIGAKGKTQNIPDGYLLDLSSPKEPRLFVVEVELANHEPLKHVAVQILEFSMSFESTALQLKQIVKKALDSDSEATKLCKKYAVANGF